MMSWMILQSDGQLFEGILVAPAACFFDNLKHVTLISSESVPLRWSTGACFRMERADNLKESSLPGNTLTRHMKR
jgi:hypothetical protein